MNNYAASSHPQQPFLLNTTALPHIISASLLQSLTTHDLMNNMGTCTTPVLQQQLNEAKDSITAESENEWKNISEEEMQKYQTKAKE
jgi:hypothetical protein